MTPAEALAIQLAAAPPYRIDWARLPENGGGTAWAVDRVYFRKQAADILAALAAAGFVVVPTQATPAMAVAGTRFEADSDLELDTNDAHSIYEAMLAARPR